MEHTEPLVCPTHKSHYFFVFVITLIIGGSFGAAYGYQKGFGDAKKLVENSALAPMIKSAEDIRALSGTVTAVSGNSITLHLPSSNPFEDVTLLDRTIIVASDIKLVKLSQRDPSVVQEEMAAYMKSTQISKSPSSPGEPPSPYVSTSATVADIKVGYIINVTAGENIASLKTFTATNIQIQPTITITAPLK